MRQLVSVLLPFVLFLSIPQQLFSQIVTVPGEWDQWCYVPVQDDICSGWGYTGYLAYLLPGSESISGDIEYNDTPLPERIQFPISFLSAYALVDANKDLWLYDVETRTWSDLPELSNIGWVWSNRHLFEACSSEEPTRSYYFAIAADTSGDSSTIFYQLPEGDLFSLKLKDMPLNPRVSYMYLDASDTFFPENYFLWWMGVEAETLHVVEFDEDDGVLDHNNIRIGSCLSDSTRTIPEVIEDIHFTPEYYSDDWIVYPADSSTWYLSRWQYYFGIQDTVALIHSDIPPRLTLPDCRLMGNHRFFPAWVTFTDVEGWQIHLMDEADSMYSISRPNPIMDLQSEEIHYYGGGYPYQSTLEFIWTEYDSSQNTTSLYSLDVLATLDRPEQTIAGGLPDWSLAPVWPNPFNGTATVQLALSRRDHVTIELFNIVGQRVKLISAGVREPGISTIAIDAGELASGIYFVRARTHDGSTQSRRITLLR